MQGRKKVKFLRNPTCRALVISKRPLMCEGLQSLMAEQSSLASLHCQTSFSLVAPEMLTNVDVVIGELSGGLAEIYDECSIINQLQSQFGLIEWIFTVPSYLADIAIEKLLGAKTSLLSVTEPISNVIEQVFNGNGELGCISHHLLRDKSAYLTKCDEANICLTFAERRVLRLLSKGWRITQIATLLQKNNKTVSAQKNSAMRRLMLNNDAELYGWMISDTGMRELNLPPFGKGLNACQTYQHSHTSSGVVEA